MADDLSPGSTPPPNVPSTTRRPRAPTITIDTSAVQRSVDHDTNTEFDGRPSFEHTQSPDRVSQTVSNYPSSELRPSFESRESRPTSSHNVSSPTQWGNPHTFLAVPNQPRSRGQSFDSEATGVTMSTSEATYVNTVNYSPEAGKTGNLKGFPRMGVGDHPVIADDEALLPDRGTEKDFERENNPFAFTPGQLNKLLNPKSLGAFHALGGLSGLERGLRTNRDSGLSSDEDRVDGKVAFEDATSPSSSDSVTTAVDTPKELLSQPSDAQSNHSDRKRIFSDNRLPEKKQKTIWHLLWMAYNDKVLFVLTAAAIIALALGIYQSVGIEPKGGVEWVEGVAIIVAIIVVVGVGGINDWQKERQFAKLNKKKESRDVKVIRSGKTQHLNIFDLLVGDVLLVETGDILPVDGIYIDGHGVKCDESSATGESDLLKKVPADEVSRAMNTDEDLKKMDPFLISGGKVTEGYGRMLVTSTGINSSYGKTMLSLQDEAEATPLQLKLNGLAEYIAKLGSAAALLLFVVLFIKFLAQLPKSTRSPAEKGQQFMTILITAVTIVVVAVPEGLPLAVTLALAYATKRMLKDRNLVRVLRSCETMGNATTVCSDKTGTLTQNVMTVVAGTMGINFSFGRSDNKIKESSADAEKEKSVNIKESGETQAIVSSLAEPVKVLLKESITLNSTAFENDAEGKKTFVGSKTETALLDFARNFLAMDSVSIERSNAQIAQMIPFDSKRKCMGVVYKLPGKGGYRLLVKGASEIMLSYASQIIADPTRSLDAKTLATADQKRVGEVIESYASRSLRTIGFICRDFATESWPPRNVRRSEDDRSQALFSDICKEMTFLGLVGIQDPLRPGVPEAVADFIRAGVFTRMVTGDNITTAKAIATECGIYTPGGLAMEGPDFRKMSAAEQRSIIPKLQVLARSSPDDKRVLVKRLKEMGETVAVTGDGTNDAPALKLSDVGFSMNITGTEVAKEASDIILMDDNFASIVNALMWGRAVNDAVRKFLQFQITVNITAVLLAFISAVASSNEASVLTAVQLLWVNLIMDTMAALALATDPPSRSILNRKPDPKSAPLISVNMWKMIIGQAIYQLVVTLVLNFAGYNILNYDERPAGLSDPDWTNLQKTRHGLLQTLVFNTFVWMQIFNALNNRRLDNRFNVFEGITRNLFFICIFLIMIGGQVLIIFVGGAAFNVIRQDGILWAIALVLGAISIPIGVIIRLIPDELVVRLIPQSLRDWSARRRDRVVVTDAETPFEFNQALYDIKSELSFIKKYKGGRLNNLKFAVAHPKAAFLASRSPSRSRAGSSSAPRTPNNELADEGGLPPQMSMPSTPESRRRRGRSRSNSALAGAAMAGIVAGSIAGGWSPIEQRDGEALRFDRERSGSALSRDTRSTQATSNHKPTSSTGTNLALPGVVPSSELGNSTAC